MSGRDPVSLNNSVEGRRAHTLEETVCFSQGDETTDELSVESASPRTTTVLGTSVFRQTSPTPSSNQF